MAKGMAYEKFWYKNFADDVRGVSLAAKGMWIMLLCEMWRQGVDRLNMEPEQFGRLVGARPTPHGTQIDGDPEPLSLLLELGNSKVCDLEWDKKHEDADGDPCILTVLCRRLARELPQREKDRENAKLRKREERERSVSRICHEDVTPPVTQESHESPLLEDKKIRRKEYTKYGEFQNIFLTQNQYDSLVERLGRKKTLEMIERVSSYVASSGKKYKNFKATILNWIERDRLNAPPTREPLGIWGDTKPEPKQ